MPHNSKDLGLQFDFGYPWETTTTHKLIPTEWISTWNVIAIHVEHLVYSNQWNTSQISMDLTLISV